MDDESRAFLSAIETRITATLTREIGPTRADIIERTARQQTRVDHLDDQITRDLARPTTQRRTYACWASN